MSNRSQQTHIQRLAAGNPTFRQLSGDTYGASAKFSPGGDATKELYIENTSSDHFLGSFFAEVRSDEGTYNVTGYDVTEDTEGAAANLVARRTDIDEAASVAVARTGGDNETGSYSAGDLTAQRVGGAGGTPTTLSPATITDAGTNVIAPGGNILIRATNFSGNASELSIEAVWAEIPAEDMP